MATLDLRTFIPELQKEFTQVEIEYYQSNVEGELISKIQEAGFISDGIILNAGAYTHTSVAIGDAVAAIKAPVEAHMSNVYARKNFATNPIFQGRPGGLLPVSDWDPTGLLCSVSPATD